LLSLLSGLFLLALFFLLFFLRWRRRILQVLFDVCSRRRLDDGGCVFGRDDHRLSRGDDFHITRHVRVVAVARALLENGAAYAVLEEREEIRAADAADGCRGSDFEGASATELLDEALGFSPEEIEEANFLFAAGVGRNLQACILGDTQNIAVVESHFGF